MSSRARAQGQQCVVWYAGDAETIPAGQIQRFDWIAASDADITVMVHAAYDILAARLTYLAEETGRNPFGIPDLRILADLANQAFDETDVRLVVDALALKGRKAGIAFEETPWVSRTSTTRPHQFAQTTGPTVLSP